MKKYTAMLLSVLLCIGLLAGLTGCGKKYAVEESTLFILKDGSVISTDIEEFGSGYDEEALKKYVDNAIKEYTDEYGEDTVKLNELKVEDGKATLVIEYATTGDYSSFTGIELFAGSMLDALSAGYRFDVDFASISDGNATACSNQDIIQENDLKVVVYKGNGNVNVTGKIMFASVENTKLVDDKTIAISSSYNLLGEAIEATTESSEAVSYDTEEDYEDYDYSEDDYSDEDYDEEAIDDDELSVDEDDLLSGAGTEELETEIEFEFEDREEDLPEEIASFTSVYTYIIYK